MKSHRLKLRAALASLAIVTTLGACSTAPYGGSTYDYRETGRMAYVDYGVIQSVRHVQINKRETGAGRVTGAVIGGAIGSEIGEGDAARVVGIIGGAILGGAIGEAIERDANTMNGYEYTIRRDDGMVFTVVQPADGPALPPGTEVRIIDGDYIRIVPAQDYRDHYYRPEYRDRR
ncbi:MAG: hypothetical protein EP340_00635 [Alphaproteobacteria bacterium]|nr:MAG: hypothetical protein EP340_00635 [Alphaproteobacteria bacterium]